MPLDFSQTAAVTLCCGVSGSGKSTFCLRYVLNAPLSFRFIFDPEGEFSQRLQITPARSGIDLEADLVSGWIVFDPHELFPGRIDDAFRFFCEWVFTMAERLPGQKVLVVDEVWKYCTTQSFPQELALVAQTGRKRGLGLFCNAQAPQRLPGPLLNELSELVCFQLQFPRALEFVEQYGFNADQVRALPALSYVSRSCKTGGEMRGALTF